MTEFVAYPGSRRLTVGRDAGRTSRRVRLLGGAADWRRDALDRIGAAAIVVAGTRPWRAVSPWPWPDITPAQLSTQLSTDLSAAHANIRFLAAAAPRQEGRQRLSILAESDGTPVVVKLGRPDDGLEREAEVLTLLTADPLPGIATPTVIASGDLNGDVAYLITRALGLDGQRPAIDEALVTFERDLADRLRSLPRPHGIDPAFVPVHGDLAPWNLRRTARGLALFDWEAARWGPAGSDVEHYREACDTVRRRTPFRS